MFTDLFCYSNKLLYSRFCQCFLISIKTKNRPTTIILQFIYNLSGRILQLFLFRFEVFTAPENSDGF